MKKTLLTLLLSFSVTLLCFAQAAHKDKKQGSEKFSKLESRVIDTIIKLPEVKRRAAYVEKQTNNKRRLQYVIWEKPSGKTPYYWVRVMEDNGVAYHDHFDFFVYPKTFLIKYYDIAYDMVIELSNWRKTYKD